jgi:hypothetical protein
VDSIKRVELTSSASAALKVTVSDEAMTALSRARTVGEVVKVFCEQVAGGSSNGSAPAVAATPSTPKSSSASNGTHAATPSTVSNAQVVSVMNQLLSATTGFDVEMITPDLSLEDDLGYVDLARHESALTPAASAGR